ncbi:MAG: hypothetical protein QOG63_2035 [Thermoleophilaceae bacterium]|nr:hypothetical protein [Thermoleophilaceae bacterium]
MAVLGDIERYPDWARLIDSVTRSDGDRLQLCASVLGMTVAMQCALSVGDGVAVLRRLPHDDGDEERYAATWTVADGSVELRVVAALDAPGPARLLSGRVGKTLVDDLLDDFTAAVRS